MTIRALIVCAAPDVGLAQVVSELAPFFDLVIAADGGARVLAEADFLPDVFVGDADSLDLSDLEELERAGVTIERHSCEKDVTDLDLAIEAVRARGASDVTVAGVLGGRIDHSLGALGSLMRAPDLSPQIVGCDVRGWILDANGRSSVALESAETLVSVLCLSDRARVSGDGLAWPLDDLVLERLSSRGVSNRTIRVGATVEVGEGVVLVVCPEYDSAVHTFE